MTTTHDSRAATITLIIMGLALSSCTTTGTFLPTLNSEVADTMPDVAVDPEDTIDLPENDYCSQVESWTGEAGSFEQTVLELVNARRSEGANCGSRGSFDPAGSLTSDEALTCAARNHALDMSVRSFFSHTNPDGDTMTERIDAAGYEPSTWGENIAVGQPSPESVMNAWMGSDGHCANIMNPSYTEIGLGYYEGNYWVQVFARPR